MRTKLLLLVGALAVMALASAPASSAAGCPPGQAGTPPYCTQIPGLLKPAPVAWVKLGRAAVRVTCSTGPCKGTLRLITRVRKKVRVRTGVRKRFVVGRGHFDLARGASATLSVKLTRFGARKLRLKKHRRLRTRAIGPGVLSSKVMLKPAKKHRHHRHH